MEGEAAGRMNGLSACFVRDNVEKFVMTELVHRFQRLWCRQNSVSAARLKNIGWIVALWPRLERSDAWVDPPWPTTTRSRGGWKELHVGAA